MLYLPPPQAFPIRKAQGSRYLGWVRGSWERSAKREQGPCSASQVSQVIGDEADVILDYGLQCTSFCPSLPFLFSIFFGFCLFLTLCWVIDSLQRSGKRGVILTMCSLWSMPVVCETPDITAKSLASGLDSSGWLRHIKAVLDTSVFIAKVQLIHLYMTNYGTFCKLVLQLISYSNWTELRTIQGVIGQVISNRLSA